MHQYSKDHTCRIFTQRLLVIGALATLASLPLTACDAVAGLQGKDGAWEPPAYTAELKDRQVRAEKLGYVVERRDPATFPTQPKKPKTPEPPKEADPKTEAGAMNAVNYYMVAQTYMLQTGDLAPLSDVMGNIRNPDQLLRVDTAELYRKGGFKLSPGPKITDVKIAKTIDEENMQVTATVDMPSVEIFDRATATYMKTPARKGPWKFDVRYFEPQDSTQRAQWVIDYAAPQTY